MISGNDPSPDSIGTEETALQADTLIKRYRSGDKKALDGFALSIGKGQFFGLLGPNGAGKTTAISIFSGLLAPDRGNISVMGFDLRRKAGEIKAILGLVPQDIAIYDKLTARENLLFFGRMYGLGGAMLRDRIAQCLQTTSLTDQADRLAKTYSGGMKRRLNLAIGLLHMPRMLLLDEPTVGIDAQSRHLIHQRLQALNRDGMTILYTTHYMEEAQELCSHVGIIDSGRIIEQGTPAELLRKYGSRNLEDVFLQLTGKQLRDP